ncbi:MAG: GGDEF domain-containing protein, partial [Oscillospiraceae bacterium]
SSVSKALSSISENDKNEVILYHITKPKGTISPIQFVKKNPITTFGVLGIIICLSLVMFYDKVIKEKDQKIDMAMHEASKDLMTGIYNRKFFEENVDADIKKEGGNLAMIMLDIDEFKSINDTYGHSFGDEVIKKVADILETFFGSESYAGRMGGDEFAVLIKDCKSENIILMRTEDLIKKINGCMENEYKYLKVKISAGIVMIDGSEKAFSDIYIMLDEALYDAKKSGKNKAILYKL